MNVTVDFTFSGIPLRCDADYTAPEQQSWASAGEAESFAITRLYTRNGTDITGLIEVTDDFTAMIENAALLCYKSGVSQSQIDSQLSAIEERGFA